MRLTENAKFYIVTPIFCFKRILLGLTTIYLAEFVIGSTYVYAFGSLFSIGYFLNNRPMSSKLFNFMESLNEAAIYFMCYFTFMFTDWIDDVDMRWEIGNVFTPLVVGIVLINIICVVQDMVKVIFQNYLKSKNAEAKPKKLIQIEKLRELTTKIKE